MPGAPGRIRTCDTRFRNLLGPALLLARMLADLGVYLSLTVVVCRPLTMLCGQCVASGTSGQAGRRVWPVSWLGPGGRGPVAWSGTAGGVPPAPHPAAVGPRPSGPGPSEVGKASGPPRLPPAMRADAVRVAVVRPLFVRAQPRRPTGRDKRGGRPAPFGRARRPAEGRP